MTHNQRVNAPVRPVTALANNASAAPGRPARYAQRYADKRQVLERMRWSPWV
jgi:hypothetical protein